MVTLRQHALDTDHHTASWLDAMPPVSSMLSLADRNRLLQPRPTNGILVAMTVMNKTLASRGRPAM